MTDQLHLDSLKAFLEDSSNESQSQSNSNERHLKALDALTQSSTSKSGTPSPHSHNDDSPSLDYQSNSDECHLKAVDALIGSSTSKSRTSSEHDFQNSDSDYFEDPRPTRGDSHIPEAAISVNLPSEWQAPSKYQVMDAASEELCLPSYSLLTCMLTLFLFQKSIYAAQPSGNKLL